MGLAAAVAGVGAISSIAGSALQAGAASSAASAQEQAAQYAADLQHQQYEQTRSDLLPYNTAGQNANNEISQMGAFNFAPTQANLATTPGYQFALQQGLRGVQNSAAARGLGNSGAALRGAADYAQGLASNTYQQQFQNALTGYNTNLAKLQNQASLGENAGAQTGNIGAQLAGNAGQAIIGGANAAAAGQVGVANALSGGINGIGNAYITSQLLQNGGMYGNPWGGTTDNTVDYGNGIGGPGGYGYGVGGD
jgi:hypothetical protein